MSCHDTRKNNPELRDVLLTTLEQDARAHDIESGLARWSRGRIDQLRALVLAWVQPREEKQ